MYTQSCKTDRNGSRHADQCAVTHGSVGDTWQRTKRRIRKVFVSKDVNDSGQDVCKIYGRDGSGQFNLLLQEQVITPGFQGNILRAAGVDRRVLVETTNLPAGQESKFYIHIEWYS